MGNVIDFIKAKAHRDCPGAGDLNELLARAVTLCRSKIALQTDKSELLISSEFNKEMEGVITQILIDQKLISSDFLLCGIYISKMLSEFVSSTPKSWCAVDFKEEAGIEGPAALKKGGDICFLICSVFPGRANWRLMNEKYYKEMGVGLYLDFYYQTSKEIGYWMSSNFSTLAGITHECLSYL